MKLLDIAHGYMELEKLAAKELPLKVSYGVNKLMNELNRPFEFYANEELKLLQEYPIAERDGKMVKFEKQEDTAEYNRKHTELDEIDEDIAFRPVRIDIGAKLDISRESLKVLLDLGMVEITGVEEEKEAHGDGCGCC